jgi:hypothetical protein
MLGAEQHLRPEASFTPGDIEIFREILRERVGRTVRLQKPAR